MKFKTRLVAESAMNLGNTCLSSRRFILKIMIYRKGVWGQELTVVLVHSAPAWQGGGGGGQRGPGVGAGGARG